MNPVVKNILAVIAGWIVGSIVNMGLVNAGHSIFPIEGIDLNDMDAVAAVMPTLDFKYFVFPFLAHALGTLIGALVAAAIAANRKMVFAFVIGGLFLLGGIAVNILITGPIWFTIADIALAYLPMAYIGGKLGAR